LSYAQQEKNPNIKCYLVDPPGSGLFNKVTRGVMYTKEEAEGRRLKNPFDTITEGIGINRVTRNFAEAKLDGAFRGTDMEAVEMARSFLTLF
jgi:cysteine synthase A